MPPEQFPILPHDVERLIFECSAEHDRGMARQLVHVSRKVQKWIDPILYRYVTLEYPSQAEAFVRTLEVASKSPGFFLTCVKFICFAYGIDIRHAIKILSACSGVASLACWIEPSQIPSSEESPGFNHEDALNLMNIVSSGTLRPQRLSVILNHILCTPDPDFTAPILENVTHLDIYQGSENFRSWTWTGFDGLACLSHLSFDLSISAPLDVVIELLPHCPKSLRVCLVVFSTINSTVGSVEEYFDKNRSLQHMALGDVDPRIVVGTSEPLRHDSPYEGIVVVRPYPEILKDWGFLPAGEGDIWEKAEEIMKNRNPNFAQRLGLVDAELNELLHEGG